MVHLPKVGSLIERIFHVHTTASQRTRKECKSKQLTVRSHHQQARSRKASGATKSASIHCQIQRRPSVTLISHPQCEQIDVPLKYLTMTE